MRRFQKAETISTPLSFPFGLGANLTVTVVTKQKKLKRFYHNPRVGGSSPSSATISHNVINILQRLKKDLEALFALHASYSPLAHFLVSFGNDVMAARRQGQSLSTSRELRSLPSRERMG